MALPWNFILPAAIQAGASLLGGKKSADAQESMAQSNIAYQKEFAKHGIQWRVADAKAAGINPLAALGVNPVQFNPVYIPGNDRGFESAGQAIGNALQRSMDRDQILANKVGILKGLLDVENQELVNYALRKDIEGGSDVDERGVLKGTPQATVTTKIKGVNYSDRNITKKQSGGIEAGISALENYSQDSRGYLWLKPTQENQEMLESSWFDQAKYILYRSKMAAEAVDHWVFHKTAAAETHRKWLRSIRPIAPEGYEYRFNPTSGFKLHKVENNESFFYEDRKGGYKN